MTSIKTFKPKYNFKKETFVEENNLYKDGYLNTKGKYEFLSSYGFQSKANVYGNIYFVEFISLVELNTKDVITICHFGDKSACRGTWAQMETRTQKELLKMVQSSQATSTYTTNY